MSHTSLRYHIVFSTKNRRPLLDETIRPRLVKYIGGIARNVRGMLIEANGPADHLHLSVAIHPQANVSGFVRDIKSNSSGWMRQELGIRDFGWQDEYSAFTFAHRDLDSVRAYIRGQQEHHGKMTFQDELRGLLTEHGIEFDERYLLG